MGKHNVLQLLSSVVVAACCLVIQFRPALSSELSPNQTTLMTILANLANTTSSSSWDIKTQPNPCLWKGVTCGVHPDNSSSVTGLSLSGFGLSSPEFLSTSCKIQSLEFLDLSDNHFSELPAGFFTGCGGIDGLKLLNFSKNKLAGEMPAFSAGLFSQVQSLDLSFNSLSGNLTSKLDGLVSLTSLNLSFNLLSGAFPSPKSLLLDELQLSKNSLEGTIPPEIGNYAHLTMLDVTGNSLRGSIPSTIGNLSVLQIMLLSENGLSGELPSNLSSIQTLIRFSANQNQFVGSIPSGLTRNLHFLDLSYNKLSGSIPTDLFSYEKLLTVDLSYNYLEGPIPENMSASLFRLRLGSNRLHGSIPSSVSGLFNLTYLELDNNSLSSEIPAGLGSCPSLALLNLAQNQLTGSLPVALGGLSKLQVLKLQSNKLGGQIPPQITQLPQLSILNVSSNSLNGAIPSSISDLKKLVYLDLQGNDLNGSIPDSISRMDCLLELQLARNQLGGRIPSMPLKLQIALNLSGNRFEGSIPHTLSDLQELEILDLSKNDFSGEIPDFLTELASLTQLVLSDNNLSGVIPEFRSWVFVSLNGNPGLVNGTRATNSGKSGQEKSVATAVLLAVGAAALFVAVAVAVVCWCSRRVRKINDQQSQFGEELQLHQVIGGNLLTTNVIHRSNIDFAAAMEAVTDTTRIELKTRFSTYYKAIMPSGTSYFVKKLNWSDKVFQLGSHDSFGHELEVLGRLSSSNVMTPLAYVLTVDSAYLFYEYTQRGTLFNVLHGELGASMDWSSRYSIAVGVAQGLTFLHGCSSGPILLFDLSSRNILLKSFKEPLIGDIELCKVIDPTKSTGSLSTVAGSVGYIPPEYAYTMRVTTAGNVYSFGVVLLELVTGKPAVSEGTELAKWVLSNSLRQDRLDHMLDRSISRVSQATKSQMLAVLKIALSCVDPSPRVRPKMKSVSRLILSAQ